MIDPARRRRLLRGGARLAHAVGLPAAAVLVSLLAVRSVGVEAWGQVVGATILVQLAAQIADFGSRDTLVRDFSREPGLVAVTWRRAAASRSPLLIVGPLLFVSTGNDLPRVAMLTGWLLALFVIRLHEGPVAYRRAFPFALAVEASGIAFTILAVVLAGPDADPGVLMGAFAASAVLRAVLYAWRLGVLRPGPGWDARIGDLRRAWPFFALTFSGAVQSRIDLYVVAALLPSGDLGVYQVVTSLVLLVQSVAGALLDPIVPALYRLPRPGVVAGARRLGVVGLGLGSAGIVGTWLVTVRLYGLDPPAGLLLMAWLAMLPAFAYLPLVYLAFREGDERIVLAANVAGIATSGLLSLALIAPLGLTGAMAGAAVAQLVILACHAWRTGRGRSRPPATDEIAPVRQLEVADALPDV